MSDKIIDANDFLNDEEINNADYSNINTLGLHVGDTHNITDNRPDFRDKLISNVPDVNTSVVRNFGFFLDSNPTALIRPKTITEVLDDYLNENNLTFKDIQDEVFDWCERKIKGE